MWRNDEIKSNEKRKKLAGQNVPYSIFCISPSELVAKAVRHPETYV